MIKWMYYRILKIVLRLFGLSFNWYLTFYLQCFYANPLVEICLQRFRSKSSALRFFAGYDIQHAVKEGDVVLDIGANIGAVSSRLLTLGFIVHAYEPDSRCVTFLKRRFSKIESSLIHIHHCAVGDHEGMIHLNYGFLTTESNSILKDKPGTGGAGGEDVQLCSIQSILNTHDYIPLIKIDIEGAEYDVLDMMLTEEYLVKFGICLVEVHANKIPDLQKKHEALVRRVQQLGLEDKVFLNWH